MNQYKCAPHKFDEKNNTCFTLDEIKEIVSAYNRYITKVKLSPEFIAEVGDATPIKLSDDKKQMLKDIWKRFNKICKGDDYCLSKQAFMNEIVPEMRTEINDSFKGIGPKGSTDWLSNKDIDGYMYLYEKVYPDFKFMGAVPLDCNDHSFCSLYKINYEKLKKSGIKKIGIIFNHDKYGQGGSHWVAMMMNLDTAEIYYCDSTGKGPIGNINTIIKEFTDYCKKHNKEVKHKNNKISYQNDNSECGVYSCNFIIRLLSGESFDSIVNNNLKFKEINSCRNAYFRNGSSKYPIHEKCEPKIKN